MKRRFNKDNLYPIATIILIVVIWEAIVRLFDVPGYILPKPSDILLVFPEDAELLFRHAKVTAFESAIGFFGAVFCALLISILMDNFSVIRKAFYPLLIISQTIPVMAIAPIMIIWFGFGPLPKVLIIIIMCFFPIAVSLIDGFSQADQDYINLFKVERASKLQVYRHLKFPNALPYFFAGLKISVTYMVMAAVIAEWLGGDQGIGVYMLRAKNAYALDKVFASIVLIVAVSVILIFITDAIGRKVVHWKNG